MPINQWTLTIGSYSKTKIANAIRDPEWQAFRKSLKGVRTELKLEKLFEYRCNAARNKEDFLKACIQVDNYINALKRGGQLDANGIVRR